MTVLWKMLPENAEIAQEYVNEMVKQHKKINGTSKGIVTFDSYF